MTWLRTIWRRFLGLFVDDGRFAIAILLWLALVRSVLPWLALPPALPPIILFVGLAVILVESAMRQASRRRAHGHQAHAGPRA